VLSQRFACLLFFAGVSNTLPLLFDDVTTYNPCGSSSGVFFYSDPTVTNKYYQCDESNNVYSLSCGTNLVWDDIQKACNWASVVKSLNPPLTPTPITATTTATTTIANILPTTSSSTTVSPSLSACKPVNPCGDHGVCYDFPVLFPASTSNFVCVCTDNWIGQHCETQIDDLTTSSIQNIHQNKAVIQFPHLDKLRIN